MAQPTLAVKDANGTPQTINTINPNGSALAAASQPVVQATDVPSAADTLFFNESTTVLGGGAVYTGPARDSGIAAGQLADYGYFQCFALSDLAGTMRIECSNDNVTWRRATIDQAVGVNTPVVLKVPMLTRYWRVVYTNGGTPQTIFMLNSGFTGA